jgi:hypothetical protein
MKLTTPTLLLAMLLSQSAAYAYNPDELAKECHKPKFTDFTLTEYKVPEQVEIAPESDFSFKVQASTNPDSIKLLVKKQPLAFTIESNNSFHKIKAKIPAEFTGQFVRLNVSAKVIDGECHQEAGWLLKIADHAKPATEVESAPAH